MSALLAVLLFGSVARGDADHRSDLDILAVVRNKSGKVPQSKVNKHLPPRLAEYRPTISWYGYNRLKAMYLAGELFAWHIFLEGYTLHDNGDVLKELGKPSPYMRAIEDIRAFRESLANVPTQIAETPCNAIYEMGVLYVCIRNIAMAASWHLKAMPDFSRLSPYRLGPRVSPCPIVRADYELSMACRLSGQRGLLPLPCVSAERVLTYYYRVAPWVDEIVATVQVEVTHERTR